MSEAVDRWTPLVGRRVLVKLFYSSNDTLIEAVVEEVSSSRDFIKLSGHLWRHHRDWILVEVLAQGKGGPGDAMTLEQARARVATVRARPELASEYTTAALLLLDEADSALAALHAEVERLTAEQDRLQQVADENYADLLDQMQERWGNAQEIGRPEINAFLESRFVHRPTESLRATLSALQRAEAGKCREAFGQGCYYGLGYPGGPWADESWRLYPDPPEGTNNG